MLEHVNNVSERRIARRLVIRLLKEGFDLSVFDGEETVVHKSEDANAVWDAMGSTDMDYIHVWKANKHVGWILLIWGNDVDLISDNTTNLDEILKPIEEWAERLG